MRTGYMQEQWTRTARPRRDRQPEEPRAFEANEYWWEGRDRSLEAQMMIPMGAATLWMASERCCWLSGVQSYCR